MPEDPVAPDRVTGGVWEVESLDGVALDAQAWIKIGSDGTVTGQAPCNRFSTTQTAPLPDIGFGPILATRMACPDLDRETAFLAASRQVTSGAVSGDVLTLFIAQDGALVFNRVPEGAGG